MYSFSKDEKDKMSDEIKCFFKDEHDLDLGIIGTENILDFFKEIMGNRIYNAALDDAKRFYKKHAEDMDSDYYTLYRDV